MNIIKQKRRVIAYVDGFNLYFGIKEAGYHNLKWLDIKALIESFLYHDQELVEIKYFTSYVRNDPPKEKKQRTYISALESTGVKIIRGKYEEKIVKCANCEHTWVRTTEKMTDVNIATNIILDAIGDKFEVAILISGDSDLVPAIDLVNTNYKPKFVTVFFPPKRENVSVKKSAEGSFIIGRKSLKNNQFPDSVILNNGYIITKPKDWN